MDGDLDVLAHAVHEIFGAHIDLAVVDVDVTDVVGGDGVASKGFLFSATSLPFMSYLYRALLQLT